MKKNILLLLAAFMAIFAAGANDQWPITLTTADGLPGAKPKFDSTIAKNMYHYHSPLLTFDEATDKLRITVCETTASASAKTNYSGRASRGPGFPYFSIAELRVYNADGASIPFEISSNAAALNSSVAALCDGDSMTCFQSTSGKGTFDGNYHYLELEFDEPISTFSVYWSSHPMSNSNLPMYVGLTPGTDYMPYPEQRLTLEKITSADELSETDALFVLEGHSPEWHFLLYNRTHPGGGFFEAPCLTTSAPSALGIFSLIPVEGKENTYKAKYLNRDYYIANPTSLIPEEIKWTTSEEAAADITFKLMDDGNFELTMPDRNLLIAQNAYMRMATVEMKDDGTLTGSDVPVSPVFTLYKAKVDGAAFAWRLQQKIDDARARLAKYYSSLDIYDCNGPNQAIAAAIAAAEKCVNNTAVTYPELCERERLLNKDVIEYTVEYASLYIDSIDHICECLATGEIAVSNASDWQKGTYPEDMEERLQYFITKQCDILDNSSNISEIDEAVASIKAAIDAFWASRIEYVEKFPFMVGVPDNKLPGDLASHGGYVWESPLYYLSEPVSSLRFTVVQTDGPTKYLGYDVPSIAEFELYDNLGNKIEITEEMITMNSLTTFGGSSLKALVDGKATTFARGAFDASRADVYNYADNPQNFYLDIQLKEPINCFRYVQTGYILGQENPVKFVFGEYGVKAAPDSVAYAEKYGVAEIEKIADLSQITDDGIYAIFGLDDCDKVNCQAGKGGFYADTTKLSATFNSQCAYTIKSAGDGKYYIRSLSTGAYWGREQYAVRRSNFRSQASPVTIAQRNVGNFPGSFTIYETIDYGNYPYLVFEDWSGELELNPLTSLEECEFDGQCDWYIYRVNVDNPELLALDASIFCAKELGVTVSDDPGCYAGMSAFAKALADAESVAAAGDSNAAPAATERLEAAIDILSATAPNPVVEGIYVIENAMNRFEIIGGARMAINCIKDDKNPGSFIHCWEKSPMGDEAIDSSFCFELISAAASDIVADWLAAGKISAEDVNNAYFIRNVGTGLYIETTETLNTPVGTVEGAEHPLIVKQMGGASFKIFYPSVSDRTLCAYNHQEGKETIGYVVYEFIPSNVSAARWNLRLLSKNTTAIDSPAVEGDELISVKYYTPGGVASDAPVKGLNIVKRLYRNGAVKSEKIFVK